MHEAIIGNKTTFLTRSYTSGRHRFEDPITSMVFGGLKYVPANESFAFFSHYFEKSPPAFEAETVTLHFWKQLRRKSSHWVDSRKWDKLSKEITLKRLIEPDLIIEYTGTQGESRYYLIEVKWDSPEGENELLKQWEILNAGIQADTLHVFMVKEKPTTCSRPEVNVRLWNRLVSELHNFTLPGASLQFETWQTQTIEFLEKLVSHFHHFSGFSDLNLPTPLPIWAFQSFDMSIVTEFIKNHIQEQNMASASGTAIKQATESITTVWDEIHALEREVNHFLEEALEGVVKEAEGHDWDSDTDDKSDSVYTKYAWWCNFPWKRGKLFCVAYYVMLLEDQEAFPGMDEPTLFVALGEEDEMFDLETFDWQDEVEEGEKPEVELMHDNKLQLWDGEAAYYAVPLTAISNRNDITTQLVNPVVAQIRERLGDAKEDEVKEAFSKADKLLSFELYKDGVRKVAK